MTQKTKLLAFLRTLLISYIFTGILLVTLAFVLYKFKIKEAQVALGVSAIYLLTSLVGGLIIGKTMKVRRFLWGFLMGLSFFLVLLGASFLMNKGLNQDMQNTITTLLICLGGGTLGGMLS